MEQEVLKLPQDAVPGPIKSPGAKSMVHGRKRRVWEIGFEVGLEWLIRLCGISAILFVFGIFAFVFREGAGFLFSGRVSLPKFLFSTEWYPTSMSNIRYGVLALIVGTGSVTILAMAIAVPFGLGAAIF